MKIVGVTFGASLLGLAIAGPLQSQTGAVEGFVRMERPSLTDALVYLVPKDREVVHRRDHRPVLNQHNLRFEPTVLPVIPGTTVEFLNSDPVMHNVFSPPRLGGGFDLGTYPDPESRDQQFTELGTHVILCHVHPEMYAYIVVVPAPYSGVPDDTGAFRIEGVPPGSYTVFLWESGQVVENSSVVVEANRTLRLDLEIRRTTR